MGDEKKKNKKKKKKKNVIKCSQEQCYRGLMAALQL